MAILWRNIINVTSEYFNLKLTQALYCLSLLSKWIIQLPRDLSVAGASLLQMAGIWPLNRARDTSSNSLLIPTSPARAWKIKANIYE